MKEDWTNRLKQKLAGHRKTPPAGLWEGISEQMGFTPEPARTVTINWRRWAAAAVVLALVGFFVFRPGDDSVKEPLRADVTVEPSVPASANVESPATMELPATKDELAVVDKLVTVDKPAALKMIPAVETSTADSLVVAVESPAASADNDATAEPSHSAASTPRHPVRQQVASVHHPQSSSRWSVGLNVSGGLLAAQTSQRLDRVYQTPMYDGKMSSSPNYGMVNDEWHEQNSYSPYVVTEWVSEHHLPIRFGLTIRYQLNQHFALLSGLHYTHLYSHFSVPLYQEVGYDQRLHYLGLPLSLACQLWSTRRYRVYVSGGPVLEKCLRSTSDNPVRPGQDEHPWQWSVNVAAGAEYSLSSQVGLYLEPSLGYYFDDGTSLEHYYKEHPLTPAIEFGLRFNLR